MEDNNRTGKMLGADDIANRFMKVLKAEAEGLVVCPECGQGRTPDRPCRGCEEKEWQKQMKLKEEYEKKDRDIKRLGGLLAYEDFTLEKYDNKKAIESCEGFPDCNLYIFGAAGTGKTHLATAVVRIYTNAVVTKPQRIFRKIRGNGRSTAEDEQDAIEKYINQRILVIDDLGVDKRTDYSVSTLYEIIDGRLMNKRNGLIITSNLSLDQLAEKLGDDRIPSRISGLCRIVEIKGTDRRSI